MREQRLTNEPEDDHPLPRDRSRRERQVPRLSTSRTIGRQDRDARCRRRRRLGSRSSARSTRARSCESLRWSSPGTSGRVAQGQRTQLECRATATAPRFHGSLNPPEPARLRSKHSTLSRQRRADVCIDVTTRASSHKLPAMAEDSSLFQRAGHCRQRARISRKPSLWLRARPSGPRRRLMPSGPAPPPPPPPPTRPGWCVFRFFNLIAFDYLYSLRADSTLLVEPRAACSP
jgi:hypothetical protein